MSEKVPDTPDESAVSNEETVPAPPPEKMGVGFYAALAIIALLVLMILFLNYPAVKAGAGAALAEHNWTLQFLADRSGTLVPVQNGTIVTAVFDRQGGMSGSTGCNRYDARFNASEYQIAITGISSTEKACPGPGIMDQESAYLSDLSGVSFFRISESTLKFYDRAGKTILVLVPA